jgi:O-methyltransferase
MEEQEYIGSRSCLYTAASFAARNFVAGDYLEFGCWQGDSFQKAYHAISRMRSQHTAWLKKHPTHESQHGKSTSAYEQWSQWKMRFFAFDSFAGLPAVAGDELHQDYAQGSYQCSENDFRRNIERELVNLQDVVIVPGYYDKSLNQVLKDRHNLRRAAVVNIDCDLYESTIQVLDFLTDIVVQGTILIFDDWFRYQGDPRRGEQLACAEWLSRNPQIQLSEFWREPPQPVSFIVSLKS